MRVSRHVGATYLKSTERVKRTNYESETQLLYYVILLWCVFGELMLVASEGLGIFWAPHTVPLFHHIHLVINTHTRTSANKTHTDKKPSHTPPRLPCQVLFVNEGLWEKGRGADGLLCRSVCHSHTCTGTTTNNSHTQWLNTVYFALCAPMHVHWHCKHHLIDKFRKSTCFVSGHYLHRCVFNVWMSYNRSSCREITWKGFHTHRHTHLWPNKSAARNFESKSK